MPAREIEIPVIFADRRELVVKISPDGTVLDLKRAIARADAVDVLAAGSNADLLGKRYTAPATFRLIMRGVELNNQGSLEYYHLTTKGRAQQPVRVCAKHDSLVSEDDILGEDFSVPETVAHLDEEQAARKAAADEARAAAKARQQTFHVTKKRAADGSGGGAKEAAGRGSRSPGRAAPPGRRSGAQTPDVSTATAAQGGGADRSNAATPDPTMPAPQQRQHDQHQHHASMPHARHPLPPLPDVSVVSLSDAHTRSHHPPPRHGAQRHPALPVVVPSSPSRGMAPIANPGAALFAVPLDDIGGGFLSAPIGGGGGGGGGGGSPDILTKMRSYLNAAERGDAPLPHVVPLPSSAAGGGGGGHMTPPRLASALSRATGIVAEHFGTGSAGAGGDCAQCEQKLAAAQLRIQQLEAAVDRYKTLLHRLTQIQAAEEGGGAAAAAH
jgi:hypothetical protein